MSLYFDIYINEKNIYTVKVSNIGGDVNGVCRYTVNTGKGIPPLDFIYDPHEIGIVEHDRRRGALELVKKAIELIDAHENDERSDKTK